MTQLREAQLPSTIEEERASKLVAQVTAQVRSSPEKYDAFLEALEECAVSQKVVSDVRKKHKENQQNEVI